LALSASAAAAIAVGVSLTGPAAVEAAPPGCDSSNTPQVTGFISDSGGTARSGVTTATWYLRISNVDRAWGNCLPAYKYAGIVLRDAGGQLHWTWGNLRKSTSACNWVVGQADWFRANSTTMCLSNTSTSSRLTFDLPAQAIYQNDSALDSPGDFAFSFSGCSAYYGASVTAITSGTATSPNAANCDTQVLDATGTSQTVTYDATAPTASVSYASAYSTSRSLTLSWTASDAVSGIASVRVFYATAAAGPYTQCGSLATSATSGTLACTVPSDGTFYFAASATDANGNAGPNPTASQDSVIVDTVAPAAPSTPDLIAASDSGSSSTDNITNVTTPTFSGAAEANSTVTVYDGATPVGTGTATGGAWTIATSALAGGSHSLTAAATDPAGNTGGASVALSVTIDVTAPTTDFTTPDEGTTTAQGEAIYSVAWTETETGSGVTSRSLQRQMAAAPASSECATATYAADGSAQDVSSPKSEAGLAGNTCYRWTLTVTDNAGNVSGQTTSGIVFVQGVEPPPAPSAPDLDSTSDTGPLVAVAKVVHLVPTSDVITTGNPVQYWQGSPSGGDQVSPPGYPLVNEVYSASTNDPLHNGGGFVLYPNSGTTGNVIFGIQPLTLDPTSIVSSIRIVSVNSPTGGSFAYVRNPATGTIYNVGGVNWLYENSTTVAARPWDGRNWTVADVASLQAGWGVQGSAGGAYLQRFAVDVSYTDFTGGGNPTSVKLRSMLTGTTSQAYTSFPLSASAFPAVIGSIVGFSITMTTPPLQDGAGAQVWIYCDGYSAAWWMPFSTSPLTTVGSFGPMVAARTNCALSYYTNNVPSSIISGSYTYDDGVIVTDATTSPYLFDNVTSDSTPTFSGTNDPLATGVELYDGAILVGSDATVSSGSWTITASALSDGVHSITAKALNAGGSSPASAPISVTVDTAAPAAPSAPDMIAVSDRGVSSTDNYTDATSPIFTGTRSADSVATGLFDDGSRVAGDTPGAVTVAMTPGAYNGLTPDLRMSPDLSVLGGTTVTATFDATSPGGAWYLEFVCGGTPMRQQNSVGAGTFTFSATVPGTTVTTCYAAGWAFGGALITRGWVTGNDGSTPTAGSYITTPVSPLWPGSRSFTARAWDLAGNASPLSEDLPSTIVQYLTALQISTAPTSHVGQATMVGVTVENETGQATTSLSGTLTISTNDPSAHFPDGATYTLKPAKGEIGHTFRVLFGSTGPHTVTVTSPNTVSATTSPVTVAATQLTASAPATVYQGQRFQFNVGAIDPATNKTVTLYEAQGSATSSDPSFVTYDQYPYRFICLCQPQHVFLAALSTLGTQTITFTDEFGLSATATVNVIAVPPGAVDFCNVGQPCPISALDTVEWRGGNYTDLYMQFAPGMGQITVIGNVSCGGAEQTTQNLFPPFDQMTIRLVGESCGPFGNGGNGIGGIYFRYTDPNTGITGTYYRNVDYAFNRYSDLLAMYASGWGGRTPNPGYRMIDAGDPIDTATMTSRVATANGSYLNPDDAEGRHVLVTRYDIGPGYGLTFSMTAHEATTIYGYAYITAAYGRSGPEPNRQIRPVPLGTSLVRFDDLMYDCYWGGGETDSVEIAYGSPSGAGRRGRQVIAAAASSLPPKPEDFCGAPNGGARYGSNWQDHQAADWLSATFYDVSGLLTGVGKAVAADPVDQRSGSFQQQVTDFSLGGLSPSLALSRVYESSKAAAFANAGTAGFIGEQDSTPTLFGPGWSSNLDWSVGTPAPDGTVLVRGPGGTLHYISDGAGGYQTDTPTNTRKLEAISGGFKLTDSGGAGFRFDSAGKLVAAFDPQGREMTLAYTSGKPSSFTDAAGRTADVTTNASGNITRVDLPGSRYVAFTYDAAGHLATQRDLTGVVTTYVTDSRGRITSVKDDEGRLLLQNAYDERDRVTGQIDALGNSTFLTYDKVARATVTVGPRGDVLTNCFNNTGQIAAAIDALDGVKTFAYDTHGFQASVTDESGKTSRSESDVEGRPTKLTDATGWATTFTYDTDGHPTPTLPDGTTSTTTYNPTTKLPLTVTSTKGTDSVQVAAYTYDPTTKLPLTITAQGGGVTTYHYDTRGYIDAVTDPAGRKTTFVTDTRGFVTSSVGPLGNAAGGVPGDHTTTWTYDDMGRVLTVTDPLGNMAGGNPAAHRTTYTYDAFGRLKTIARASGALETLNYDLMGQRTSAVLKLTAAQSATTTYEYDAEGNLTATVDAESRRTETTYDLLGRARTVKDPNLKVSEFEYDAKGRLTKATDATGVFTTTAYDPLDRVTTVTDPAGKDTTYAYDPITGLLSSVTDPLDHTTSYGYDWQGHQTSVTNAKDQTAAVAYNADGTVASATNARSKTTAYTYNPAGQLLTVTEPGDSGNFLTTYDYDAGGRLHTRTNDRSAVDTYDYDALGRPIRVEDADDKIWQTFYANDGQVDHTIDGKGQTTSFEYDLAGRLLTVTPTAPTPTIGYTYDKTSRRLTMTDGSGTTSYGYDPDGRVTSVEHGGRTSTYTYDDAGRPGTLAYPAGAGTVSYGYDTAGRLQTINDWSNRATTYHYDDASRATSVDRPGGLSTTVTYDELNRPLTATSTRVATTILAQGWTYDENGNIATATDDTGQATFGYDNLDRLVSAAYPAGQNYGYTYDSVGNLTQAVAPSGTTNFTYDLGDRITSAGPAGSSAPGSSTRPPSSNDGGWTSASNAYASDNAYATATAAKNQTTTLNVGTFGFGSAIPANATITNVTVSVEWKVSTTASIATLGAQLYAAGVAKGSELVNTAEPTADTTQTFTVSGLTRADLLDGTLQIRVRATRGNSNTAFTASLDAVAVQVDYTAPVSPAAPTYDDNGNMTSDGTYGNRTHAYDTLGRQTGVTAGGATTSYALDGAGNRWSQTTAGTTTAFDLDLVAPDPTILSDGTRKYLPGAPSAGYDQAGVWQNALVDLIGSPILMVSSAGAVSAAVHFDPYGAPRPGSGAAVGIGYAGEYRDATGLINLRARSYDPLLARFIGRDTFGGVASAPQTGNRYAYALANPLRYTDPSGHLVQAVIHNPGLTIEIALSIAAPWSVPLRLGVAAYFAYTAISGYDPLTGHSLSPLERGLAILPALSEIARGVSAVLRTSEALGEAAGGLRLGGETVLFGQRRASPAFSLSKEVPAYLRGRTLVEVAKDLRTGRLTADMLPIQAFRYGEHLVSANTRTLTALSMAGLRPTRIKLISPPDELLDRLLEPPLISSAPLPGPRVVITPGPSDLRILGVVDIPGW